MKGDKLVGKYYVEFDKHYKEEIAKLESEGIPKAEASKKAPLIIEAQEMLRKWESGDAETVKLWRTMNDWVLKGFDTTYKEFGVDFDKIYYESETYLLGREIVMDGINKGYFYKKEDASVWCDLDNSKLDHKLVLRSDGTSVYITQDIGTATQRFSDYSLDQLIYVVGDEQNHHFKVLFEILKKMEFSWAANCHHLSYGMVELPSGKMKSREGTVVDADDLMENMAIIAQQLSEELGKMEGLDSKEKQELYRIIGLGALKYFLIKVDPKKKMMFNPEESIDFNGNTGPFIQYTYARIQSLVRKQHKPIDSIELVTPKELAIQEKQLIKHMYQFPAIIHESANALSPALVANYVYEVAKSFNHYYQALPILKAEQQEVVNFRIHLSKSTGELIKTCMNLLGIEMPDRM
jgi:arginyl-tRNA synthetase